MPTAEDHLELAERCRRVAKTAHNGAVAQMLEAMAADYARRAEELQSTPVVQRPSSSQGS
jgi:hypothetical protein